MYQHMQEFARQLEEGKAQQSAPATSHDSVTLLDHPEDESIKFPTFEELFVTPEIINATKEYFGNFSDSSTKKWDRPEDYTALTPVQNLKAAETVNPAIVYNINTINPAYTLSPVLIPNHKQYHRPNFFEKSASYLNDLFSGVSASPKAKQIKRSIQDITPIIKESVSDTATYKIAPKIVDTAYLLGRKAAHATPKQKLAGLGAAFAMMAACTHMGTSEVDSIPQPSNEQSSRVTIDLSTIPVTHCSKTSPMIVETTLGTFVETDTNICKRIKQAVPAPSAFFTQYNKNIAVRALEDGTFVFRLVVFKEGSESFDQLLTEHPKGNMFGKGKVLQAYADTYRLKINDTDKAIKTVFEKADKYAVAEISRRNNKPYSSADLALGNSDAVKKVISFRQNHQIESIAHRPISANNYRAAVGGWLISPLPLSFYLAKWNRESGFNENAKNPGGTARGLNQFTIATFLTVVKKYGNSVGLEDLRTEVMRLSKKHGHKDWFTIKDPEFIALFKKASVDPNNSTALGVLNTTSKAVAMQEAINRFQVKLPGGRKFLNEIDIMMLHYLGDNAKLIWRAMDSNSQELLINILPSDVYQQNKNDFKNITAKQFYAKLSRASGFGTREIDATQWFKDGRGRQFSTTTENFETIKGIGTQFKLVANQNTIGKSITVQSRPNVTWVKERIYNVGVEPIPATPTVQ